MADPASPTRTLRKRERTRGELVAAAEGLVAARGLDAVSIDEIVAAADVAKGTFYTHFTDKNDLAAEIAKHVRWELEGQITRLNEGCTDAALRMANGLSSTLAFAIAKPVRARALMRLQPALLDPEAPINAGLRGDVVLGLKSKRFTAPSANAAVVTIIGAAMAAIMRLTDGQRDANPKNFAAEIIAVILVSLGLKQPEATRLANAAMAARKKDPAQ
jgi:AcrR family transcriptional regulator